MPDNVPDSKILIPNKNIWSSWANGQENSKKKKKSMQNKKKCTYKCYHGYKKAGPHSGSFPHLTKSVDVFKGCDEWCDWKMNRAKGNDGANAGLVRKLVWVRCYRKSLKNSLANRITRPNVQWLGGRRAVKGNVYSWSPGSGEHKLGCCRRRQRGHNVQLTVRLQVLVLRITEQTSVGTGWRTRCQQGPGSRERSPCRCCRATCWV